MIDPAALSPLLYLPLAKTMSRDDDQSLGDEATPQGGKPTPGDERSLGDRSTFGSGEGSSLSDLGEFADLPDHDMEIVDLSSRYKIENSLGKGGIGEVLLARQREESEKKRAAAKELAAKQRTRKLQRIVGSSIAAAFVFMLSVMFYLRAEGIARDISEALSRVDYVTALQLDPSNAEALSMKRAADIKQALSDGDYVAALLLDPNNAEALSVKKVANILKAPPLTNSIGMKLKSLPSGTLMMGDANGDSDETPHEVTLTQSFQMGIHEVTQEQYERVMGNNPSRFKAVDNPVEQVTWADAVKFCRKLSELPAEKSAGRVYRLPTEAEWEYACRAGTTTAYSFGDDASDLGDYAWFAGNGVNTNHPVGGQQPNAWGLHDMHGNVWEWCQDWYGDYPGRAVTDPTGATSGSIRVNRGGSWNSPAVYCRSAHRCRREPSGRNGYRGFRVSLSPSGQ